MVEDQAKDKAESSAPPGGEPPRKKWVAFWISLMVAFYLMTLALANAVYTSASNVDLLREGVRQNVDLAAVGLNEDSAETFAVLTLAYLQGRTDQWELSGVVGSPVLPVPGTFMAHMATVRGWFAPAGTALLLGHGIAVLLLWALFGFRRGRKDRFSYAGYYTGALIPLVFIAGVGLWGALDFQSMWYLLHKILIPDGIFSASEPIMQLFPLQLFAGYAKPVATYFGIIAAVILMMPVPWGIRRRASQKAAGEPLSEENTSDSK